MICDRTAANGPSVVCRTCQVPFAGDRSAARRAGWIPASTATQHDVDTGPLVCPRCEITTTDALLEAMRSARTRRTTR